MAVLDAGNLAGFFQCLLQHVAVNKWQVECESTEEHLFATARVSGLRPVFRSEIRWAAN